MKTIVSLLFGMFLVSLILPQPVLAFDGSGVSLTPNFISSCPARTLSVDDISLFVTNTGPETDTFYMSIDWLPGLYFIEPMITLASGESAKIEPLWITIPYNVAPGSMFATITVESGLTGETVSRTIEINILNCHVAEIDVSPIERTQEMCSETHSPVEYTLGVTNLGLDTETFELSTSVQWATTEVPTVTLMPLESKAVILTMDPPSAVEGFQTVSVTAQSTSSFASDTQDVFLDIADCYNYEASMLPSQANTCLGKDANFTLLISNTGQEDTFDIIAPEDFVTLSSETVTIPANDGMQIYVTVSPPKLGDTTFEMTIQSQADIFNTQILTGTVGGDECKGVSVIVSPSSESSVCQGDEIEFDVTIRNTGSLEDTFDLTATHGVLEQTGIVLGPDETLIVPLTVDTSELTGETTIEVSATDGTTTDTATTKVVSRPCFVGSLSIEPDNVSVCPFTDAKFDIVINNIGENEDSYDIEFGNTTTTATLQPQESKPFELTFPVGLEESTDLIVTATALSQNGVELEASSSVNVKDMETCYAVSLTNGDKERARINAATTIPLTLRNEGEQPGVFQLSVQGPDYVYLEPRSVALGFDEEREVYMYISPPFGEADVEPGEFTALVSVFSEHAQTQLDIPVAILPPDGLLLSPSGTPSGDNAQNVTLNDTNGTVSLNVSVGDGNENGEAVVTGAETGNETGVTGGVSAVPSVGDISPLHRTIIVAVITLIIVVILIVRFAFLFKN